ncbi:chitin-binding domain-containing protein [Rubellimicrobium rubrum]|nr:chitin-binding domain-containing protein [Rubellimicrobium rubrum]
MSAWAQCSSHDRQAMSCTEGTTWDQDRNACVPIVTG